ncbi:Serine/threonine/tyrosine-interacting protein [Sciurus carolinensis]|uniref:Serine/threonine/tyrosine-interacting protein n=1 Tax=Sciurus carolinensis TaxID=30640 RepID=A0AA41NID4_SCICA|nr:Serine/threonine/tyrosine-interacting protein [Sciurus carolinensis]
MAIPSIPYERRLLIMADPRDKALQDYRKKLLEHKEIDGRLKELREQLKELTKQYEKSENDLKALQSVGQIVGEVLKQLTEEKFIVKATNGPRYVVGCRRQLDKSKLKPGTRVALDMTTLTIMRYLVLDIADNPVENIIRFFPMTKEFIDGSLQTGGKVLVHGNAGISRSAAFVIAYIMETFGVKYRDAFAYVQERRFCINPNAGFVHQLQEYEAIYLAKLTIQMMSPLQIERSLSVHSGTTGSLKRTHEEEDDFGNMQVATAQNG